MTGTLPAVLAAASLAAVVLAGQPPAGAQTTPKNRVVDRTFVCRLATPNVDVSGRSGVRSAEDRSRWKQLASAQASVRQGSLAWMAAGAPKPPSGERFARGETLVVSNTLCRPRTAAVPLAPRGLSQGGKADVFGDAYDCWARKTILLRVRAEFRSATSLQVRSGTSGGQAWSFFFTTVPMRSGRLAVATPARKLVGYADVAESGRARVFAARGCLPD